MKRFSKNSDSNPLPGLRLSKFAHAVLLLVLAGVFAAGGCSQEKPAPKIPLTEAQKKFEKKCRDEFDMHVKTRMVGHTLYIYLPTQEPIFDYEAQKANSADANKKPSKFAVQFADGSYKAGRFLFEYDIVPRTKAKKEDYGYNSSYTDSYVKQQNNLYTAISDVFFNVEVKEASTQPLFFVIIITDIKKGIEMRATLYLEDFKRYMTGDLPYEEYMKRFLADTKGGQDFIGDETGTHITYTNVEMPDFLAKQIVNRINFKFQHSDFEPPNDFDNTIVGIIADTLRYYDFKDFTTVQLNNLRPLSPPRQNVKYIFEKNQLESFSEDVDEERTKPQGKLIRIRFDKGNVKLMPEEKPAAQTDAKEKTTEPAN